ncbi:LysR family transcriptional regulator [Listeria costaricensis]|uniref:LysR family transcriptional regulator n=1 Tax=Listeria costaricensis TaxID=2026604 RepID=UPI000C076AB4|nr:LysR family transcriptional regulator [Listeria costaricensis]
MNLRQLYYFRKLAEKEHYTEAAAELSITQPSLSHAISELEKELGTYLFEKQGRNIRLTKYGRFFLAYVEKSLDELEKGERLLQELTSPSKGKIDLGFIYTMGAHFVPELVQEFTSQPGNQEVTFSFFQGATNSIIPKLKAEKFDLAICSHVEDEPEIQFTPITRQELVIVVAKNHPLAQKSSIDLYETADYPFVFFADTSGLRPLIDDLFAEIGVTPNIACYVEEDTAMAGLVSVNYGIAIMPNISSLPHYDVKVLPLKSPEHDRFIYLATVKNRYLPPAARKFRDFAIQFGEANYLHK